jgi:hypothetical protein
MKEMARKSEELEQMLKSMALTIFVIVVAVALFVFMFAVIARSAMDEIIL